MSLRERVKSWIEKAREQLRSLRRDRHAATPGSPERKDLGRDVRHKEHELEELKAQLAAIDARHDANLKADWNGCTPVLGAMGEAIVKQANAMGLVVTSTNGGTHSPGSYHYSNLAIDFGVAGALIGTAEARTREIAFQNWLDKAYPHSAEIFGPDSHYIKNGQRYGGMFPAHGDHVHVGRPA